MEKRLFLAIILSILVLMIYSSVVTRLNPSVQQQPVTELPPSIENPISQPLIPPVPDRPEIVDKTAVVQSTATESLQTSDISIFINPIGTGIKECKIAAFDTTLAQTDMGLLYEWRDSNFTINSITPDLTMSYINSANNLEVQKTYRLTSSPYIIEMDVNFVNRSDKINYIQYSMNIGSMSKEAIKKNSMDERYIEFSAAFADKTLRGAYLRFNPRSVDGNIDWAGIRDRYFCVIVRPMQDGYQLIKNTDDSVTSYLLQTKQFELAPGAMVKHKYLWFIGPQKSNLIEKLSPKAVNIVNFGVFDALSHLLLGSLRFLYKISKNWGITIILFSFLVFVVLSPLSIKSFRSMKRMQELQPIIEELRAKYKDSPQKMNKEIMEIYREKKINPLGGCLPLFLQMPIFIALYQTLMRFIDLKGARFLWIKDLSEPDRLKVFSSSFPVVGNELNILPIIMIVTMLVQQKLTTPTQPQSNSTAQQQKMMSLFMAVFFGIIFYHMPSGLVLYWSVNSILMLIFQVKVVGKSTPVA